MDFDQSKKVSELGSITMLFANVKETQRSFPSSDNLTEHLQG